MRRLVWFGLAVVLLAAAMLAVSLGPVGIGPADAIRALSGDGDATTLAIVRGIRLPRVALAALVGAGLGMSGAALQGTLRNPLAEPYLLGISGGAALGAVAAATVGIGGALLPLAAFAGALGAVALVLALARVSTRRSDPRVLLMAGVIIGAFANAVIMLVLATAPADTVRNALWWMMGSVAGATWGGATWLTLYVVAAGALLLALGRQIDLLALGEESAAGLGVDVERASRRVYLVASLMTAATVSAAGLVGFVGLLVPHLVRGIAGRGHRSVMGAAALAGAALLILADLAARTLRAPTELPLGAVTALAGVPFFLARLRRHA
jgi:iron complex transport system permease protein